MASRGRLGFILLLAAATVVVWSLLSVNSCSHQSWVTRFNAIRGDSYPLDSYDRTVDPDAGVQCPEVELEVYAGDTIEFSPAIEVTPAFAERLRRFESVLAEVSRRHYGRAPLEVVNAGAYACRAVRHRPQRLSEHALGNAIDVVGFDFGPYVPPSSNDAGEAAAGDAAPRAAASRDAALSLPDRLRSRFSIRVPAHWQATEGIEARHARFLEDLTDALVERDVFRTLLGPGHPTHGTHFHFDMAPYSYVQL